VHTEGKMMIHYICLSRDITTKNGGHYKNENDTNGLMNISVLVWLQTDAA
jgi:hypothetical protein